MKNFLSSIFICLIITSNARTMEQQPDQTEQPSDILSYLVINEPDKIVGYLDLESLCSLSQTCKSYKEICDAVPTKYLSFDFCDAAELQNKKFIERFMQQANWLFEPGIGQEVFVEHHDDESKVVKIFKQTLNAGVERYIAGSSFYCVSEGDKVVLYFCVYQNLQVDDEDKSRASLFWVNASDYNKSINLILKKYLQEIYGDITSLFDRIFVDKSGFVQHRLVGEDRYEGHRKLFELSSSDRSVNNFIKEFGMFLIWFLSAQKNNATVIRCIFDKSHVQKEYWLPSSFSSALKGKACKIVAKVVGKS